MIGWRRSKNPGGNPPKPEKTEKVIRVGGRFMDSLCTEGKDKSNLSPRDNALRWQREKLRRARKGFLKKFSSFSFFHKCDALPGKLFRGRTHCSKKSSKRFY